MTGTAAPACDGSRQPGTRPGSLLSHPQGCAQEDLEPRGAHPPPGKGASSPERGDVEGLQAGQCQPRDRPDVDAGPGQVWHQERQTEDYAHKGPQSRWLASQEREQHRKAHGRERPPSEPGKRCVQPDPRHRGSTEPEGCVHASPPEAMASGGC